MNILFIKDYFNPDTNKTIKTGKIADIIEWKAEELVKDGIASYIKPVKIVDDTKSKEFRFEEVEDPELDKYTPKKKKNFF